MKFKKRGTYETLEDYIKEKTGNTISELDQFPKNYQLKKIPEIGNVIYNGMCAGKKFLIHADYDVDGLTAAVQMALLFYAYNYPCRVKIPMRFTDGYGVKVKHTEHLDKDTILILVDNGISALEAVQVAKEKGATVLILDHHMGDRDKDGTLICPPADIVLDPAAMNDGMEFPYYCGSGLVYKLVQYMISDRAILDQCSAFAALGTVADVVPLYKDNRNIVKRGLAAMNRGDITFGLWSLIECINRSGEITSETIAFYIAPLINAPGRLDDKGGTYSAQTLLCQDPIKAEQMTKEMKKLNDTRKQTVAELIEQIRLDPAAPVNVVRTPNLSPEGCLGLIAGKLVETTGKTTFVYTKTQDGFYKGSARSDDENNNPVHLMLAGVKEYLSSYGGHPGAAGFSFTPENEESVRSYLLAYPIKPHDFTSYYDLSIQSKDLILILNELDQCEPFGKGIEKPIFRMPCNFTLPEYWRAIGADSSHISFKIPNTSNAKAIGFGIKERYILDGMPKNVIFYGYPKWNWYKGEKNPQFLIEDYEIP